MMGADLRRVRAHLGETQVQLARRLGVHEITLSRWETGKSRIPAAVAQLLQLLAAARRPRKGRR